MLPLKGTVRACPMSSLLLLIYQLPVLCQYYNPFKTHFLTLKNAISGIKQKQQQQQQQQQQQTS